MDSQRNPEASDSTPQNLHPQEPSIHIKHGHKFIYGYLAVLVFVAGLSGVYSWQHSKVTTLSTQLASLSNQVKNLKNSSATETASVAASENPRSFYDCIDAGGTESKTLPLTCSVFGYTYPFPKTFSILQVDNLEQVPSRAIPLITSIGQANFKQCSSNLLQLFPSMYITLAQSNFVDVGVGCDSGHHEYLGLKDGKWIDLGGSQDGLSCIMVSQYDIKQSSLVTSEGSAGDTTCSNTNGTSGTVPAN
jgi:hypothetical protein